MGKMMSERELTIDDLMARPYHRVISGGPNEGYLAEVLELPGCVTAGESPEEALSNLHEAMSLWFESALDHGDPIPDALAGPVRLSA